MLASRTVCSAPDASRTRLPLQPNHRPSDSRSAARIATANPPARCSDGSATRLETTTSRLIPASRSRRVLPGARKAHGRADQPHVRIGLREVAPGLAILEAQVLRQQAQRVAPRQHAFEQGAGFVVAADRSERFDVPERADGEAGFRRAEIVRGDVTIQAVAAAQLLAD